MWPRRYVLSTDGELDIQATLSALLFLQLTGSLELTENLQTGGMIRTVLLWEGRRARHGIIAQSRRLRADRIPQRVSRTICPLINRHTTTLWGQVARSAAGSQVSLRDLLAGGCLPPVELGGTPVGSLYVRAARREPRPPVGSVYFYGDRSSP